MYTYSLFHYFFSHKWKIERKKKKVNKADVFQFPFVLNKVKYCPPPCPPLFQTVKKTLFFF